MTFSDQIDALHDKAVAEAIASVQAQLDEATQARLAAEVALSNANTALAKAKADADAAGVIAAKAVLDLRAEVTALKAEVARLKALTTSTSPPPVPPTPPTALPTGAAYVTYESLAGNTPTEKFARGAGRNVTALPGLIEGVNFKTPSDDPKVNVFSIFAGSKRVNGFIGSGIDKTVISIKPFSSTRGPELVGLEPFHSVTPFNIVRFDGVDKPLIKGFTLKGTDQGHIYSGMVVSYATDPTVEDVKITGIPASDGVPPGETYPMGFYKCTRPTSRRVEVDGRREGVGGVSSSAVGYNGITTQVTVENCNYHHIPIGAGTTFYKCSGGYKSTDTKYQNCVVGVNFERYDGLIELIRPTFGGNVVDMVVDSDIKSNKVNIIDPIVDPVTKVVTVCVHTRYYYPYVPNMPLNQKQLHSDITVTVGGVNRPDLLKIIPNYTFPHPPVHT